MDNCVQRYRYDLSQKLKNLRSTNPKDYWKILNASSKDKKCAVDINDMLIKANSKSNITKIVTIRRQSLASSMKYLTNS